MEGRGYLISGETRWDLRHEQTTVGRLSSNLIVLNDPTVSKHHASIHYFPGEDRFYLRDNNTVNGTYLNGLRLPAQAKHPLAHKDSLQFGKHQQLVTFCLAHPPPARKGKINLKDYCFELDSEDEQPLPTHSQPPPTRNLKIPKLEDYLELSDSHYPSHPNPPSQLPQSRSKIAKQGRVRLPDDAHFEQQELPKVRKEQQTRKNEFLFRQAQRERRERDERRVKDEKMRLQVERFKQEEEMLRKQLELEQRVVQEQLALEKEKKRVEQELLKAEQSRRQEQMQAETAAREREQQLIAQLQAEKQQELAQLRQQEEQLRSQSEASLRDEVHKRKQQLQLEAQALAQQYEQVYRQALRRMKNDIDREQNTLTQLQQTIQHLTTSNAQIESDTLTLSQEVTQARKELHKITSRNTAFVLYASELQNRMDAAKQERADKPEPKKIGAKLKEEVANSRKLLTMKRGEWAALKEEINRMRISLSLERPQNSTLETILANHEEIQQSKVTYFELLREENALREQWGRELAENEAQEQDGIALEREVAACRQQLEGDIRDQSARLAEQRLHMLKCLHYLPQEKKRAARFLIEEMSACQREICTLVSDGEQTHARIHQLVVDSDRKRSENQQLSELLFGADPTAHHFDNMKQQINQLVDTLANRIDPHRVARRLQLADEIQAQQAAIHNANGQLTALRQRWRQGLRGQKVVLSQKNPIVFFGDLLGQREQELRQSEEKRMILEQQCSLLAGETSDLEQKISQLGDQLQRTQYLIIGLKRDELKKVRQSLL